MKNVFEHAGLVNRRVEKGEREGRLTYTIISELTYDTDISDLWDALLTLWLFLPKKADLKEKLPQ